MAAPGSVIIDPRCNKMPDAIDVEANCNFLTFQDLTFTNDGSVGDQAIRVVRCSNINILNNNINGMGDFRDFHCVLHQHADRGKHLQ